MTARTYILIFFCWAILTVVTPTLIFLSESSKLGFVDSDGEKSAEIKTRKMKGHVGKTSKRTLVALVKMQAPASRAAAAAAPASAPAPAFAFSYGFPEKEQRNKFSLACKKLLAAFSIARDERDLIE